MAERNEELRGEEDEQVICSNQLLAAIRERMAKKREGGRNTDEKLRIPEPESD